MKAEECLRRGPYAIEERCRKGLEMDHAETRTNPCHLHLNRSGSSQTGVFKEPHAVTYVEAKSKEAQEFDAEVMTKYSETVYLGFM